MRIGPGWIWRRLSDVQTLQWLWLCVSGTLIGGAVTGTLAAIWALPLPIIFALGLAGAIGGFFLANEIPVWRARRDRRRRPVALEIQFLGNAFPFVQDGRFDDLRAYRLFRVAVQSFVSGATVDGVEVKLTALRRSDRETSGFVPVPVHLHRMNDNVPPAQWRAQWTLNPGQTDWWDVVLKPDDSPIEVQHIVPGVNRSLPTDGNYELEIRAFGRGVQPSIPRLFKLWVAADQMKFEPLF